MVKTAEGQLDLFTALEEEEEARAARQAGAQRAARERGRRGMERAAQAKGGQDGAIIDEVILRFATTGQAFSANDVRPWLPDVRRPAIGARFGALAKAKRIVAIGMVRSTDPGTNGHRIMLWRGADPAPEADS
ncbi:hypothetical protein [Nocardiopsis synnemataformans]|uniref:hypothetical protein n=1 Tax=Nocardiopsis synnemataformans TaxID=61305 RepID=UPI003EB9FD7C